MKSKNDVDRFIQELGEPVSTETTRQATTRVLENLSVEYAGMKPEAKARPFPREVHKPRWIPVTAIAAALLGAVVLVGTLTIPGNGQTIARRVNGKLITSGDSTVLRAGQVLRTDSAGGAVLVLRDGTRMEMSSGVELSIDHASDGIQINLTEGNVIVTAAKQHNGHLYVKTRDCMVSVVGTVFSVKAEAAGSRVAVIEGEVHVQHGNVSQTLLPGQLVSTNPAMTPIPLQSEIGWSQAAVSHIALLQQSTTLTTPASAAGQGDDIVYPRFTDTNGLLKYQYVGTVNLNVLNFDYNPAVLAYVPACPNFWEFMSTSVPRNLDTFGPATSGTTPFYTLGGASFELVQGSYRIQLRTQTVPNTSYYDGQLAVLPGSNQNVTLQVPGPDSSATPTYSLSVTNNLTNVAGITVYSFATSLGASVPNGGGTATYTGVHGCSQITVRNSATNAVVDSFVFPIGIATYTKIYNTSTFNFILTNGGTYPFLLVYQNNLLIGEVRNKRQITFSGIKQNDVIVVKDGAGTTRLTINPFPDSNQSNIL